MPARRYEYRGDVDVSVLTQPLSFGQSLKSAPNRLLKSAMSEGLSTWDVNDLKARGVPTDEYVELYRR